MNRNGSARIVIMMGVAGCGKTTVGRLLAERIGARFLDGDDLHPPENVAKMSSGQPLTDADRWPWLTRVSERLRADAEACGCAVGACSALRRRYREHLIAAAGEEIRFIHLAGAMETIAERMAARANHFMPTALLASQFDTLEPPQADEPAVAFDIGPPPAEIVARILSVDPALAETAPHATH